MYNILTYHYLVITRLRLVGPIVSSLKTMFFMYLILSYSFQKQLLSNLENIQVNYDSFLNYSSII